jgi:hypothetical protein
MPTKEIKPLRPTVSPTLQPTPSPTPTPALVPDTLPGDYPVIKNWSDYIIYSNKAKGFAMADNLNPEFLGRLGAFCEYMTEKYKRQHPGKEMLYTIAISQGYRTEEEQGKNDWTSWHENGIAVDTFHENPDNKWLHFLGMQNEVLQMFGFDNSITLDPPLNYNGQDWDCEFWHIQAIEVTGNDVGQWYNLPEGTVQSYWYHKSGYTEKRKWAQDYAPYDRLEAGFK